MKKYLKQIFIASLLAIALPQVLFAAEISVESKAQTIAVGQQFEVGVFLNTNNESINAIEGKITFPQDLLEIKKISDGGSVINFWIEKPKNESGQIAFSGIIPGGYDGKQGLILYSSFLTKKEGNGVIRFSEVKALRNDGQGTEATLTTSDFHFVIREVAQTQTSITIKKDRDSPEAFTPEIASDPAIFEGQWFLVFATQDKGSGIDHYEVREGNKSFIVAESPYLLQDQNLDEEIIVKTVDKNGNERIATLPAQKPRIWYENYGIFVILIIVVLAYLIWKLLWKKRKKSN